MKFIRKTFAEFLRLPWQLLIRAFLWLPSKSIQKWKQHKANESMLTSRFLDTKFGNFIWVDPGEDWVAYYKQFTRYLKTTVHSLQFPKHIYIHTYKNYEEKHGASWMYNCLDKRGLNTHMGEKWKWIYREYMVKVYKNCLSFPIVCNCLIVNYVMYK